MSDNSYTVGQKAWMVVKTIQARLRFVAILLAIGLVLSYWDTLAGYYEKWTRTRDAGAHRAGAEFEFYCPMDPQFVTDNPKEKCPICHMELSKRKKSEHKDEALPPGVVSRVQLAPYRMALAGVQTSEIRYRRLAKEIETVGFVEFDERNLAHIAARVKGRIDKLNVNITGQVVTAGEEMASLYSPDLVVTVQNLLDAARVNNVELQRSAADRLRLWGIDDTQVSDILRTGKANTHLKIRSPITGHVIRKYQVEGKYVDEGTPLYDVAELSTVWIQAQIYEDDMAYLKKDQAVAATSPAFPGRVFSGKIAFLHPHLDRGTRTLTVRFDMDNPEHELRPGMYATVKLQFPVAQLEVFARAASDSWRDGTAGDILAQALNAPLGPAPALGVEALMRAATNEVLLRQALVPVVPESAVIDTGSRKIVYREVSPGVFEGVEVQLGPRGGSDYPVLRGLEAGTRVVTAGSFLIDAETRLNPAAGSIYFGGGGPGNAGAKTDAAAVVASRPALAGGHDVEVQANRARLRAPDRRLVEAQEFCPILESSRLGSMGTPFKIVLKGQTVFLCCKGCRDKALAQPDQTLERVEQLKRKAGERGASAPR